MELKSQEHHDVMAQFEREFKGVRLDRERKEMWSRGVIYQDGHVNELFLAYRRGYAFAKCVYISHAESVALPSVSEASPAKPEEMCDHEDRVGGNDYMLCHGCGAYWDWRKDPTPPPRPKKAAKELDPEQRIANLFEALADHTETMSDEEIIAECIESGEDPDAIAEHTRGLLQATYDKWAASQPNSAEADASPAKETR